MSIFFFPSRTKDTRKLNSLRPKFQFQMNIWDVDISVSTDRRSLGLVQKKILDDRSIQDLKIAKKTSKDLFFDPGTIIMFFKMDSLES
jgi:hypothetical protein